MSGNIIQMPFCKPDEVVEKIRHIATNRTERLFPLPHASMRMEERGVTRVQIQRVLKNGEVLEAPIWDTEGGQKGWKCKLRGVSSGTEVTVVAKLVEDNGETCLIVTVWC